MSDMKPDIDLDRLARAPTLAPPRRRLLPRLVPWLLVLAFAALLVSTLTDFGRGALPVTVVRPQAARGETAGSGGGELQRSGWVEPEPWPTFVVPLVEGVVRELLVKEGDAVAAGDVVARLDEGAARVAHAIAQARLARATAEAQQATVEQASATRRFEAALAVTEALAVAEAEQRARAAALEQRQAAATRAQAAVTIAEEELAVARDLATHGGAGPRQVELAAAAVEAEQGALAMARAEAAMAAGELEKAAAMATRAQREFELRLDDRERLDAANASLQVAQAAALEAQRDLEESALRLERHAVVAPVGGVVLQRTAAPGAAIGGPEHLAMLTLYDPAHLRVRIDVEQSEVAKLAVGGMATIRAPTREQPYAGRIVRIVRQANVEKVTLQVHVAIEAPDEQLRPEMLVETRFALAGASRGAVNASGGGDATGTSSGPLASACWIASRLLEPAGDGAALAWVIDGEGRAQRRRLIVARRDGERTLIGEGLNVSDKVIDGGREQLREGARVTVTSSASGEAGGAGAGGR